MVNRQNEWSTPAMSENSWKLIPQLTNERLRGK